MFKYRKRKKPQALRFVARQSPAPLPKFREATVDEEESAAFSV
jgi:hypothetical protein